LAAVNALPIAQSKGKRLVQILGELALITIASFLGPHRIYRNLYLIVIGKGALLLNRASLVILILAAIVQQIAFATEFELSRVRHVALFPSLLKGSSIVAIEQVVNFVLALLLVVFFSMLLRSEQQSRRRAQEMKLEVDSMTMTLERERIARDIHDSLGHALTGLNVQLQLAQKLQIANPTQSHEAIGLARGFAVRAIADVRRAVRAVRDSYFDFPAAVKELAETVESSGNCQITVDMDPLLLPPQLSHNLFFLIQESLTNIQRHARATHVHVQLKCGDQILLRVKDDGIGYSREGIVPGFGITGMEERVASLGGAITIATSPGQGTDITISIPISAAVAKESPHDQRAGG
jgi:signal transduction histidine kinase